MDLNQVNLIDHYLSKLQNSADQNGGVFWSKSHLWLTAKTAIGLLPSVAVWYLLLVQAYSVFLGLNTGSVLWENYPLFHLLAGLVLLVATLFIARVSERAKSQNKFSAFAIALFGSFFLIVISPTGWAWIPLLVLGFTALVYWLTPWSNIREQFNPVSEQIESTIAVVLVIMESISNLPYPQMRPAMLKLLKDLLEKIETETNPKNRHALDIFAQELSEYAKPLLAALSYRAKSLKNDTPELMQFIERYPPFPSSQRVDFNLPATYLNVVLKHDSPDEPFKYQAKLLWLKSALIVADQAPKTTTSSLCDIELVLLSTLLDSDNKNDREIKDLLIRFMQRLADTEYKLNVFQQNSWLKVLQQIHDLPEQDEDIRRKWCGYDYEYPDYRKSFAEKSFAFSQKRENKLKELVKNIWSKVDGSDTGPSLIGIKSDMWKMGLIDDEVALTLDEACQKDAETHVNLPNHVAKLIMRGERFTFYELLKTLPDEVMVPFLSLLNENTREEFYQAIQKQFEADVKAYFETLRQKVQSEEPDQQTILNLVFRYIRSGECVAQLILRQIDEFDESNYIQDPERYEYDIENKLNQASLKRVDQVGDFFKEILGELKSDIETGNLELQTFIDHLGYKFGALFWSINQAFSNEVFDWFLHTAQNKSSRLEENLQTDYAGRIMLENIAFHTAMVKGDKAGAFRALNQLFILHSARYPMQNESTLASLVSCIEMLSQTEQPVENIQEFFAALESLPKDYPSLTPEKQQELQETIKLAIAKYDLMENHQLNNSQKNLLGKFILGMEQ